MDGCYLCKWHGCDDCMFITKAWEYNRPSINPFSKYRKMIINW